MNLFLDTSALIKKYINEQGSNTVDDIMNQADNIYISAITAIESFSTFKRLLTENAITENDYKILRNEFNIDYNYYTKIVFDENVSQNAQSLIEKYQLKTLDSIQLASAVCIKNEIDFFVVCDNKLIKSGLKEKFKIINPVAE